MEELEIIIDSANDTLTIGEDTLKLPESPIPRKYESWIANEEDTVGVLLCYTLGRPYLALKEKTEEAVRKFIESKEYKDRIEIENFPTCFNPIKTGTILRIQKPITVLLK